MCARMAASRRVSTRSAGGGLSSRPISMANTSQTSNRVLLIDNNTLPRDKSCGGMLNEYAQEFLAQQFGAIPQDIFVQPNWINFRFFDWDRDIKKATSLRFANVDRQAFDSWLLKSLPENVDVLQNTRFVNLRLGISSIEVWAQPNTISKPKSNALADQSLEQIIYTCDYLVGADGPRSEVRRHLPVSQIGLYKTLQDFLPLKGLESGKADSLRADSPTLANVEPPSNQKPANAEPPSSSQLEPSNAQPPNSSQLEPYFDCIYARGIGDVYGYGYVIPKGDIAIVGSVFYPKTTDVLAAHKRAISLYSSYYPYNLEPLKRESWVAAQVKSKKDISTGYGRVLLVGEAGGLFSPSSGEGISFALNSGTLAGQAICEAKEFSTNIGRRKFSTWEKSDALKIYEHLMEPTIKNIERRLHYFPVLNSDWGKDMAKFAPNFLVDKVAHRI